MSDVVRQIFQKQGTWSSQDGYADGERDKDLGEVDVESHRCDADIVSVHSSFYGQSLETHMR